MFKPKQVWLVVLLGTNLFAGETWWQPAWNRRCRLVVAGAGRKVNSLPITITGKQLKALAGSENLFLGSLRVVAAGREVPCQVDEFDGGQHPAAANHMLDDNDELVFQADIPAGGTELWLYWSTQPLPPPVYPSTSFLAEAMDPDIFQHDLQLWNDNVFLGLKGPARGTDPARNSLENWGAGCLVMMDFFRKPGLHIRGAWSSIFPLGAIAGQPGPDANRWQRPTPLVSGPVRISALTSLSGAAVKTASEEIKMDLVHRVWLYQQGALVCFEEFLSPAQEVKNFRQEFSFGFQFSRPEAETIWYGQAGSCRSFTPDAQGLQAAAENKIIASASGLEDWFAWYCPGEKSGYGYFLDKAWPGEKRENNFYTRNYGAFRSSRLFPVLTEKSVVVHRFWASGLKDVETADVQAFSRLLTQAQITFSPVEKK